MAFNLLDTITSHITPDVIGKASSMLGESTANTQKGLAGIIPALLGQIVNTVSTEGGASRLIGLLNSGGHDGSILNNVGSLFSGGPATQTALASGQQALGALLGGKTDAIASAVSGFSGLKSSSVSSLLALATPVVLGVIGRFKATENLSASGLASSLLAQKASIASALPAGLSNLAGLQSLEGVRNAAETAVQGGGSLVKKLLPWLVIALIAIGVLAYMRGCGRQAKDALMQVKLPNGETLSLLGGGFNYNLVQFLANGKDSELPKTFVFDHLNFDSASAQLTPESVQTEKDLIEILKAYPAAEIQLAGYTDNTGDPAANQKLSLDRANSVQDALVSAGIAPIRISTSGFGQERPVASNDTEEGKARNRRTELVVVKK